MGSRSGQVSFSKPSLALLSLVVLWSGVAHAIQNPTNVRADTRHPDGLYHGDGVIGIHWSNTPDVEYAGSMCVGSEEPITWQPSNGTSYTHDRYRLVADGVYMLVNEYAHSGTDDVYRVPGKRYYYKVFQYDNNIDYSTGVSVSAVAEGPVPGLPNCSDLVAEAGGSRVFLRWTNPADSSYATTLLVRSTSQIEWHPEPGVVYHAGESMDNMQILSNSENNTFYFDSGLTNHTTYYYAVFAVSQQLSYAWGARINAIPEKETTSHYYRLLTRWGEPGGNPGQFSTEHYGPQAIELVEDRVLVADSGNWRIQEFTKRGDLVDTNWEHPNTEPFRDTRNTTEITEITYLPNTVTSAMEQGDGPRLAVAFANDPYGDPEPLICTYNMGGSRDRYYSVGAIPTTLSMCHIVQPLGGTQYNMLYIAATTNNRVYGLLALGLDRIGEFPSLSVSRPLSIVPDWQGAFVYIGDEFGRIRKFTWSGSSVGTVAQLSEPELPLDMAVDKFGNYYVLSDARFVYKYDKNWDYLTGWGGPGDEPGLFQGVARIAVDDTGLVYVTDPVAARVNVFYETDVNGTDIVHNAYVADPVNTNTGYYVHDHVDLSFADIGQALEFKRTYNSGDDYLGILGFGWRHSLDLRIAEREDGSVVVLWGNGREDVYEFVSSTYRPRALGVHNELEKNVDGTFILTQQNQTAIHYGSNGKASQIIDKNSNTTSFAYNDIGRLTRVTSASGRAFTFNYHPFGFLSSVIDNAGRSIHFEYDDSADLIRVIDARGNSTQYQYDVHHWITVIIDPRGNQLLSNTYDEDTEFDWGRVTTQLDPGNEITAFDYKTTPVETGQGTANVKAGITEMTDPFGNVTRYEYDSLGRMIKQTEPNGTVQAFEYDDFDSTTKSVDPNDNETVFEYDTAGNMTRKTDPLGNTVSITYNAQNQPLTKTDELGNTASFEYDANGNVVRQIDPLGNETTYTYDAQGLLTTESDPLANMTSYGYDVEGNLIGKTDPNGNVTTYSYDTVGRRTSETNALGYVTTFSYDAHDNLLETVDALGQTTQYEYDENDSRTKIVYPDGSEETFEYDEHDYLITETDALGRVTRHEYDAYGRKIKTVDAAGNETVYVHDSVGNLVSETDGNGNTTTFEYDANGNRTRVTDSLGNATAYTYDALDRNTSITDPLGNVTSMTYDPLSLMTSRTTPDGGITNYSYDPLGRKISETDPRGNTTHYEYDAAGRLVSMTDAQGSITQYGYDATGNRTSVTDPLGNTTTYEYDALNRLVRVTDALGNLTETLYDALGRKVGAIDALGRTTTYEYDQRDRLTSVIDARRGVTRYAYDAAGNMISYTNARNKTTEYAYDSLNQQTRETTPLGHSYHFAYDAVGNRVSHTGPDDLVTTYSYDTVNRLLSVLYPDGLHVQHAYDAADRRVSMVDGVGTTTYVYDVVGRITQTTDPFGSAVGYSYDVAGNRTAITYPDDTQVTYTYDALNRMLTVSDWDANTTSYEYDAAGRLVQETAPNGIVTAHEYDAADRLIHKTITKPGDEVLAEYVLTLDAVGNRTNIDITQPLMPASPEPEDTVSQYDDDDRILWAGDTTFQFDERGRMASKTSVEGTTNYTFDYRDRLIEVTAPDRTDQYQYDGDGNRLRRITDGQLEQYVLDLTRDMSWVFCSAGGTGELANKYLYGSGLVSAKQGEYVNYYHFDPLGNAVAMSDSSATIIATYSYDEYGSSTRSEEADNNPYAFVGQLGIMSEISGLLFMRARFYDPSIGRFLSWDPVQGSPREPTSLHNYIYVNNDPVNLVDPTGLVPASQFALHATETEVDLILMGLAESGSVIAEGLSFGLLGLNLLEIANDLNSGRSPEQTIVEHPTTGMSLALQLGRPVEAFAAPLLGGAATSTTAIATATGGTIIGIAGAVAAFGPLYALSSADYFNEMESTYSDLVSISNYQSRRGSRAIPISFGQTGGLLRRTTYAYSTPRGTSGAARNVLRQLSSSNRATAANEPIIYERYEPTYRRLNKNAPRDMN